MKNEYLRQFQMFCDNKQDFAIAVGFVYCHYQVIMVLMTQLKIIDGMHKYAMI